MKGLRRAVAVAVLFVSVTLLAQSTRIRLATFVPARSIWDNALRQMGSDWRRITQGRVTLTVFSGGSQGTEASVVRKMRLNQLEAAALTLPGLTEIDPAFNALGIPFFFDSDDELYHVLEQLRPTLERRLESEGFILLNWGHGGWAHVFATMPIRNVNDLKKARLRTSSGDDRTVQWFKDNGFTPVPVALPDVLTALQTGRIEALPTPPYAALLLQWYRTTDYMLDIPLGPVVGATVITRRAWNRLSEEDRAKMLEAARRVERRLAEEVPRQDQSARVEMEKRRLRVSGLESVEAAADFRSTAESLAESMRGGMVPADIFDMVVSERESFRIESPPTRVWFPLGRQ